MHKASILLLDQSTFYFLIYNKNVSSLNVGDVNQYLLPLIFSALLTYVKDIVNT